MRHTRILVVDDEQAQREILVDVLSGEDYRPVAAATGSEALAELGSGTFDLVITDLRMPGMDGLELLEQIGAEYPGLPVLLMTAFGSVSSAVQAMRNGAYDYLQKPFSKDELLQRVRRVAERAELVRENARLRKELGERASAPLLGNAPAMRKLRQHLSKLADLPGDVLISGESGTGKELVARALHYGGSRAGGPFVAVNCAAIPAELAESELFGHEKGAFTHAISSRAGRFEQADGGTLFLDEISSMPVMLQVKLLRVVEDRAIERVGASSRHEVDIRILAATNRDLPAMIRSGEFREDLFHRLNVHEIGIPPLRDRGDDIDLLAEHFRDRAAERFDVPPPDLASSLIRFLRGYEFPGNVRELQHMMEKMVALSDGEELTDADLPPSVRRGTSSSFVQFRDQNPVPDPTVQSPGSSDSPGSPGSPGTSDSAVSMRPQSASPARPHDGPAPESLLAQGPISLADVEERLLREAIRRAGGNLSEAARQLSISYKTMRYRARKFGLEDD